MNQKEKLFTYLKEEATKINTEFPAHAETTQNLLGKIYTFFNTDFEDLSDNKVYRCFLLSFKDIICSALETDVPKKYLQFLFKSLNKEIVVGYLCRHAKSRATDIRFDMDCFLDYFVMTWQGWDDDRTRVMEIIVATIDRRL